MRVLMLVSEAPPIKSGIARVAGELTEGLRRRGIHIDVLSANEIRRAAFKEYRISSLALHWPSIQRRLGNYDILHVHGTVPSFSDVGLVLGRAGLRLANPTAGIVYTHHSDIDIEGIEKPVKLYNSMHDQLLKMADHVVASTPTYALRLESSTSPGRLSAVGFGVRAEQFQSPLPKAERFNVLFVGQLRPYKGVDLLLKAWQLVDNADLHIVGDGHERDNLKRMAADLGLQNVHFHGSVTDAQLKEFYSRAHALVLPSKRKAEAFGLVLLEGMAAGCVPIASDLPGVSDVVGTSGYTFPVGDYQALADVLISLRDNEANRRSMSVLAVARSLACDWDYTAEAYEGIYRQVFLGRRLELAQSRNGPTQKVLSGWLADVARVTQAERASMMLVEPGTNDLRIAASVGIGPDVVASTRLRVGQRLAGFAAHTGRPMLVRRRGMPALARLYMTGPELTSSLIVPVHVDGRPVAVLNLARGPERFAFTPADQRWLQRLVLQVAPQIARHSIPPVEVVRPVVAPAGVGRVQPEIPLPAAPLLVPEREKAPYQMV